MIPLLLSLPLLSPTAMPATPEPCPLLQVDALQEEYKKRRAEAGKDPEKLWDLVDWCEANGLESQRKACLVAILKVDDTDVKAHELLGHILYEGEWFDSEKKLEAHKKKVEREREREAEKRAKELGWVRHGDRWVDPEDLPYLEKGWIQSETGEWLDPEALKRLEEGWVRQDLEWVRPEEKEKLEQGLWKCGDAWLPLPEANAYHAELGQEWRIPGEHFDLVTTLSRDNALAALAQIENAHHDLERLFGLVPREKPRVVVLRSMDQYAALASGSEDGSRLPTDLRGMSSVHGAFFGELWVDLEAKRYLGAGVAAWDEASPNGDRFGKLFARHAAGLSFLQGIDPSAEVLREWFAKEPLPAFPLEEFWDAKLVPAWLWRGAASYVERYYVDSFVAAGGDPHWTRKWAVENLSRRGPLDPFERIFEFPISADDPENAERLISEAGLVVAFVLDGGCAPVVAKHEQLLEALRAAKRDATARKDLEKAVVALQDAIVDHEAELKAFAGL